MNHKTFALLAGIVFFVMAMFHLARVVTGWDTVVDTVAIPEWVSLVGLIVAASLSYSGLRLSGFLFASPVKNKRR